LEFLKNNLSDYFDDLVSLIHDMVCAKEIKRIKRKELKERIKRKELKIKRKNKKKTIKRKNKKKKNKKKTI
jgi:hypothetical protein